MFGIFSLAKAAFKYVLLPVFVIGASYKIGVNNGREQAIDEIPYVVEQKQDQYFLKKQKSLDTYLLDFNQNRMMEIDPLTGKIMKDSSVYKNHEDKKSSDLNDLLEDM